MADIIVFILVGAVIGLLARLLMPGPDPIGILGTVAVGIVGAIVGGYLWKQIFGDTGGVEWIGSILVAMGVLWVYRRFAGGRRTAL